MHLKDNNNTYNTIYHKRHYISQSETLIILIQLNTKKNQYYPLKSNNMVVLSSVSVITYIAYRLQMQYFLLQTYLALKCTLKARSCSTCLHNPLNAIKLMYTLFLHNC